MHSRVLVPRKCADTVWEHVAQKFKELNEEGFIDTKAVRYHCNSRGFHMEKTAVRPMSWRVHNLWSGGGKTCVDMHTHARRHQYYLYLVFGSSPLTCNAAISS